MAKGFEYRVDGGTPVDAGNVLTIQVTGLTAATEYDFEVRKRDDAGNYSGWSAIATATTDAGGGGVTWVHGSEFTSTGNDITRQAGGSYGGWANTDTGSQINASGGAETKFEFYILDNANYTAQVYLAPASGSPYSADPTASTAPVYLLFGSGSTFLTVYEWNGSSYAYNTDVGSFDETDKVWFGFDSTAHLKVWVNETPIYTASGTLSGNYVLLFNASDETPYQGIQNVVKLP